MRRGKIVFVSIAACILFLLNAEISYAKVATPVKKAVEADVPANADAAALDEIAAVDKNIKTFITKSKIKGASLAVVKDGAIVYAKGYGYANVSSKEPVEPYHLFRIASVSKLITATGIMQLVKAGVLSLDQKVFGPEGILNDPVYCSYRDPRYEKITVKMLLNHSGGWSGKRPDPMFCKELVARTISKPLPLSFPDIVSYVFRNNLDFEPGLRSSYSNFGYVLLGEVIKKVSRMDYESFIRKKVFLPLGIKTAFLSNNYPDEKHPNEVSYYDLRGNGVVPAWDGSGEMVPRNAGGNDLRMLGPAGGWIASSVDIAKLLIGVAGYEKHNIIPKDLISEMTTRQTYVQPLGWIGSDNNGRYWRSGSLSGTSAMVVKEKNGLSWVFLSNTSTRAGNKLPHIIDAVVHSSISKVQTWPNVKPWSFTNQLDSLQNL
jgi:Beta-lactamase class C and other penicillin binding proteins